MSNATRRGPYQSPHYIPKGTVVQAYSKRGKPLPHGTFSNYERGCRCDKCDGVVLETQRRYQAKQKAARAAAAKYDELKTLGLLDQLGIIDD